MFSLELWYISFVPSNNSIPIQTLKYFNLFPEVMTRFETLVSDKGTIVVVLCEVAREAHTIDTDTVTASMESSEKHHSARRRSESFGIFPSESNGEKK